MTRISSPVACVCILMILFALGCASAPPVKRLSNWRVIELHEKLCGPYEQAWRATVEAVSRNWPIELANARTGYFRTRWVYDRSRDHRGRLIAILKRPQRENPLRIELQTEVQTCRDDRDDEGGRSGWRPAPGRAFNRDTYIILAQQLGRTVLYGIEQPVIRRPVIR
jgi:hypothetical protein